MRSHLFLHVVRAKHAKKVCSKSYHQEIEHNGLEVDGIKSLTKLNASKGLASKQVLNRTEKKMITMHKNSSRQANQILKHELEVRDEGNKGIIGQFDLGEPLNLQKPTRDGSNNVDPEKFELGDSSPLDYERASIFLSNAQENTLERVEEDTVSFLDAFMTSEDEIAGDANCLSAEAVDEGDRHNRMLEGITGMPKEAFLGKRRRGDTLSEALPEPEVDGNITIQDLLDPLHGKPGYNKLRKNLLKSESNAVALQPPLPRHEREKLERKVAYKQTKKDITKWEPLVKRNREAPTVFFDEDIHTGYSTVGAIASKFEPRSEFEKNMSSLFHDPEIIEAHKRDGLMLLDLNMVSVEDVKEQRARMARMRNLLFRHEIRAKRIKKIKSKTYRRILRHDRLKRADLNAEMDSDAAKELAMKQEFRRAEERMTLKHKNSSRWAKRILKRGLKVQDESTRAAIAEQLQLNALLTRKMTSMNDGSSDSESDDDENELSSLSDGERTSRLLAKAKENTLQALEDDEMPKKGVLSLPFMVRGMKKRKEAAEEEAKLALQEYDAKLREFADDDVEENEKLVTPAGRRVFGQMKCLTEKAEPVLFDGIYNSENDDSEAGDTVGFQQKNNHEMQDINVDPSVLFEDGEHDNDALCKLQNENLVDDGKCPTVTIGSTVSPTIIEDEEYHSDPKSEEMMVDGVLSAGEKSDYELPSQAELLRQAFAGDDVEQEFEKEKLDIVNEENPEPEKPLMLPGWGQWTHIQQKRGMPSWMIQEHAKAKKKREDELKLRKDANFKHVIISEKVDKKAEKLHLKAPPFPYTSKETFEQSIRMPLGPEFNPTSSARDLTRPAVVKKSGVIIRPIQFEDVDPFEKDEQTKVSDAAKLKKGKNKTGKHHERINKQKIQCNQ